MERRTFIDTPADSGAKGDFSTSGIFENILWETVGYVEITGGCEKSGKGLEKLCRGAGQAGNHPL